MTDFRGLDFVRSVIARAVCIDENAAVAAKYAEARWGRGSRPASHLKAAVSAATTSDSAWAGVLVDADAAAAEFFALVREKSVLGRMPLLRRLSFAQRMVRQVGGLTVGWIGERAPIGVTSAGFNVGTLAPLKIAALTATTTELARFSDPDAELSLRDDLVAAMSEALDYAFCNPANAGVAGVKPAAISSGVPTLDYSNGLHGWVEAFAGDLSRAVILGNPKTFARFAGVTFPNVGVRDGEMLKLPTIVSRMVPTDILILADQGAIGVATGGTEVDASKAGTVQLDSAPDSPATGTTNLVSLWQHGMIGLRGVQTINWAAGSTAISVLTNVEAGYDSP